MPDAARGSSAYCNFITGGIKSFADDLIARTGPVSSRVALSLRSAEGKPVFRLDFSLIGGYAPGRRDRLGEVYGCWTQEMLEAKPGLCDIVPRGRLEDLGDACKVCAAGVA